MTALSRSGPVDCCVTPTEERLQRKRAVGEPGSDLQVQPLQETLWLMKRRTKKKKVCTLQAEINMIYWMITSSAAPAVARDSKWVDPLVLAQSLSVLSKREPELV